MFLLSTFGCPGLRAEISGGGRGGYTIDDTNVLDERAEFSAIHFDDPVLL